MAETPGDKDKLLLVPKGKTPQVDVENLDPTFDTNSKNG
jgi:hypothetical protein